jgi:hypothetical protein
MNAGIRGVGERVADRFVTLIVVLLLGVAIAVESRQVSRLLPWAGANALQRGRQRRTMSDMRNLAAAIESYKVDHNLYPDAACQSGIYTEGYPGTQVASGSFAILSPTYIAQPPRTDGWSRFILYNVDSAHSDYLITSYGRDGFNGGLICGTTTNFNADIVFADGAFIQWPEGPQQ